MLFITYKLMELSQLFVHNLKKWRKEKGLSQKALAERCEAAHSYIRQIESGKGHPSFIFIEKLAFALNIEPYQLLFDETKADKVNSSQTKLKAVELIKSEFMEKMINEFDTVIKKIMT